MKKNKCLERDKTQMYTNFFIVYIKTKYVEKEYELSKN